MASQDKEFVPRKGWCCCGGTEKAKPWQQARWKSLLTTLRAMKMFKKSASNSELELLLRMYAHEDVVDEFRQRDGSKPQELCNFLIHGNYKNVRDLERFLLDKCASSLRFSHLMYFFVSAFAHRIEYVSELVERGSDRTITCSLLRAVEIRGSWAGAAAASAVTTAFSQDPKHAVDGDKAVDGKSRAVSRLPSLPVVEEGVPAAAAGAGTPASTPVGEPPARPPMPPRSISFDGAVAEARGDGASARGVVVHPHATGVNTFLETIGFVASLTTLADTLIPVPPEDRLERLKAGLLHINESFLPSSTLYLPVGPTKFNRLLRVHADRSFAFSTKSRVPYLTVMEVAAAPWIEQLDAPMVHQATPTPPRKTRRQTIAAALRRGANALLPSKKAAANPVAQRSAGPAAVELSRTPTRSLELSRPRVAQDLAGFEAMAGAAATPTRPRRMSLPTSPTSGSATRPVSASVGAVSRLGSVAESHDDPPPNPASLEDVVIEANSDDESAPAPPGGVTESKMDAAMATPVADGDASDDELQRELQHGLHGFADGEGEDVFQKFKPSSAAPPEAAASVFSQLWEDVEHEVRAKSPYGRLPGWRLVPVIIKSNDDLRQEQFVSQLLKAAAGMFKREQVPVWVRAYDILATSPAAGLIEAVPDAMSLDSLKKRTRLTLPEFFEARWGPAGDDVLAAARRNFAQSLAAYGMLSYILQIKDRHNGNILLDAKGHIIHIDFGFVFTNSPGGNVGFESAPFKLTQEFIDVMGGDKSELFGAFRKLCVKAFLALRKHRSQIIVLVEMMLSGNSNLPCFVGGADAVMKGLQARFLPGMRQRAVASKVNALVTASMNSWRTRAYDRFQKVTQAIEY